MHICITITIFVVFFAVPITSTSVITHGSEGGIADLKWESSQENNSENLIIPGQVSFTERTYTLEPIVVEEPAPDAPVGKILKTPPLDYSRHRPLIRRSNATMPANIRSDAFPTRPRNSTQSHKYLASNRIKTPSTESY